MKTAVIAILILVVIAVAVLVTNGSSRGDGVRRHQMEIKILSVALESYKDKQGNYPSDPLSTEQLRPNASFDPKSYIKSSQFLYRTLSADDGKNVNLGFKEYLEVRPQMLRTGEPGGTYFVDPWGNSYGYSTFKSVHRDSLDGYNPTFDLWSTAGGKREKDRSKWAKNW